MIGFDRLAETRNQIHHEITGEFDGSTRAWCEAQGLDLTELRAWAKADMDEAEAEAPPLPPWAALLIGVQIGLRLGRTAVDA